MDSLQEDKLSVASSVPLKRCNHEWYQHHNSESSSVCFSIGKSSVAQEEKHIGVFIKWQCWETHTDCGWRWRGCLSAGTKNNKQHITVQLVHILHNFTVNEEMLHHGWWSQEWNLGSVRDEADTQTHTKYWLYLQHKVTEEVLPFVFVYIQSFSLNVANRKSCSYWVEWNRPLIWLVDRIFFIVWMWFWF